MADTLFDEAVDQPVVDPEKDYFSELVGDGKKYNDTKAAGRAIVEKDLHIAKVEKENAAIREELAKRKSMADLVDQIEARTKTVPAQQGNNQSPPAEDPTNAAPAASQQPKVEDLVRKTVEELTAAERASDNRRRVADVLTAQWGPGYAKVLAEKASALGVGTKFIDDLAGRSPAAVLQMVGVNEQTRNSPPPAQAVRANPGGQNSGQKNFAFYENMRKTNPQQYFSAKNTQAMLAALTAQGDDFYR